MTTNLGPASISALRTCCSVAAISAFAVGLAQAQMPVTTCDAAGIGSATLKADVPGVTIDEVSTGTAEQRPERHDRTAWSR